MNLKLPWQKQISGTDDELDAIYFATPESGWVVGYQGIILHTDDGGRHWEQQQRKGATGNLVSVTFASPQIGWAVGDHGMILHTQDGGRTSDMHLAFLTLACILICWKFLQAQPRWLPG